jgi:tRNA pseudouridine38-40 synthase
MYNQIRKMVGLAVMVVRTKTPLSVIPKTFTGVRLNIPRAPGLGLLLEKGCFGGYNARLDKERAKGRNKEALAERKYIDFDSYTVMHHFRIDIL